MENNDSRVLEILKSVMREMFNTFLYVLSTGIYPMSRILVLILPYLMLVVGLMWYKDSGLSMKIVFLIIPLLVNLLAYFLKSFVNRIGKGETPPVPNERFTSDNGDGEISVEHSRLQELILFVNDYEEWLERKGFLRK